jgi:hypothetical protein
MKDKIKIFIFCGVAIWVTAFLIGAIISIFKTWHIENFAIIIIVLTAFHPDPVFAESSNKLFFYGWMVGMIIIFAGICFYSLKKKKEWLALIFFLLTLLSFLVGVVRFFLNLHIA